MDSFSPGSRDVTRAGVGDLREADRLDVIDSAGL
jgi:hypothetical protein